MSMKEMVQDYYRSIGQKDDYWQTMYSADAIFSDASKTLHATGQPAVI
jgi:hypothetical protein